MPTLWPQSETQVAEAARAWLEAIGFETYAEVQTKRGARADIVGIRGPRLAVIESKTSFSLAVIEQAASWSRECSGAWVAVPFTRNSRFAEHVCVLHGIGVLRVQEPRGKGVDLAGTVHEVHPPKWTRGGSERSWLRRALHPAQRVSVPGAAGGGYSTPYRRTCEALAATVRASPGITLKAAIEQSKHHYSTVQSARGALSNLLKAGRVYGVHGEIVDGVWRLTPADGFIPDE